MKKANQIKKLILISLVITSLVVFNSQVFLVLAEGEDSPAETGDGGEVIESSGTEGGEGGEGAEGGEGSATENGGGSEEPVLNEGSGGETGGETDNEGGGTDGTTNGGTTGEDASTGEEGANDQDAQVQEEAGAESENTENNDDPLIVTGDAEGETLVENEVNTNIIDTNPEEGGEIGEETSGEELSEEANENSTSSEDEVIDTGECQEGCQWDCEEGCEAECDCYCQCQCDCEIAITNENEALVENDVEMEGESGDNQAINNSSDSLIYTGNVNLVVGLINTVNTNIINSDFSQFLFNILDSLNRSIYLSNILNVPNSEVGSALSTASTTQCLDVINDNTGEIDNEVLINASSGSNMAESENGNAIISTGDVNVATSIFNLLNTNIISSNWTSLIVNVFDDWVGDLLFPSQAKMQKLLESFNQGGGCIGGSCGTSIMNSSDAQIENEVSVEANTGGNEASGESADIYTGDANAEVNLLNIVNTDLIGGTWLLLAINVFGNWEGNVFGLPAGLGIDQDFNGIKIYNLPSGNSLGNTSNENYLSIVNDNTGIIKNSVIVNVSTGDNLAQANNGQAIIETGNANVFTSLVNILNSNLIGANWLLGVINVFGDWQGNLAFGRPDLWVGLSAIPSTNPANPGGSITYTLTYINNGDSEATGVVLTDDFNENYLSVTNSGGGTVIGNPGEIQWDIGTVPVGGSGSVSYTVSVDSEIPQGRTLLTNVANIDSFEDDWNSGDNIDTISVEMYRPTPPPPTRRDSSPPSPKLEISKTHDGGEFVYAGNNVDYQIVLTNKGYASAYNVVVEDVLVNGTSEAVSTNSWDLGEVLPNEEIIIDYTVAIGSEVPAGLYTNTAQAKGVDEQGDLVSSSEATSVIEIRAVESSAEEVIEEEEEEISLEEIEEKLKEIKSKIEIIREEIQRYLPEVSAESLIGAIPGIFLPAEALAQEEEPESFLEEESQVEETVIAEEETEPKEGFDKFLAMIGGLFNSENIWWFLILFIIILIILSFLSIRKRVE